MLIDDATMKIGEIYVSLNQPQEAIKTLYIITDSMKISILKDKAQFRIGEIFQNILKDRQQAILTYEELLRKYPNSLYAGEARKRIRALRGENL